MCGISVLISRNPHPETDIPALRRMAAQQAHRGPDGSGTFFLDWDAEWIGLAHQHLAITDSHQAAPQPFLSGDESYGIVFNGEIYNAGLLRSRLEERGVFFRSQSDTEVLLEWIRAHGRKGLAELEGMYAFVYWDSHRQFLLIHRDGHGIKPLWFARNRNFLAFASEPEALLASGLFPVQPDFQAWSGLLRYRFLPRIRSPWAGIWSLAPGEAIEYWESKPMHYPVPRPLSPPETGMSLSRVLKEACAAVLPRDEAFGLMLSGGVDSTLLLKYCLELNRPFRAYSIRQAADSPLSGDQEAVALLHRRHGFPLTWVDFGPADMARALNQWEEVPAGVVDPAYLLTRAIARQARQDGIRILISGAGADEWFGGYRRHAAFARLLPWMDRLPESLPDWIGRWLRFGRFRDRPFPRMQADAIWEFVVTTALSEGLSGGERLEMPAHPEGPLAAALVWDQLHYLVQDVLWMSDRATMAEGVEGRFPFLHPGVTGFAESVPVSKHLKGGRKALLKAELADWMGPGFANRRKQGFGLPLGQYFQSESGRAKITQVLDRVDPWAPRLFQAGAWDAVKIRMKAHPERFPFECLALWQLVFFLEKEEKK